MPSLLQTIACRLFGDNPLSEPMMVYCQLDPKEHIQFILYEIQKFSFKIMLFKISNTKMAAILSRPQCFNAQSRTNSIPYHLVNREVLDMIIAFSWYTYGVCIYMIFQLLMHEKTQCIPLMSVGSDKYYMADRSYFISALYHRNSILKTPVLVRMAVIEVISGIIPGRIAA